MGRVGWALIVAAVAGLVVTAGSPGRPAAAGAGRGIALFPLTDFPRRDSDAIATLIRRRYGVRVVVLAPFDPPASEYDRARHQLRADDLAVTMLNRKGRLPAGISVGIGLTTRDLYAPSLGEDFAFAYHSTAKSFAIVSTARADPRFFGLSADNAIAESRIRKLIARTVGVFSLVLPYSDDPRSVLSRRLNSLDDLDFMEESFAPAAPTAAQRRWLAGAAWVCTRGAVAAHAAALGRPATPGEAITRLRKVIGLEQRWFAMLERVPAAAAEHARTKNLAVTLDRIIVIDRHGLAGLTSHWSISDYRRWLIDDGSAGNRGIWLALGLGSRPCSQFIEAI